jgi:rare lipoprotein A
MQSTLAINVVLGFACTPANKPPNLPVPETALQRTDQRKGPAKPNSPDRQDQPLESLAGNDGPVVEGNALERGQASYYAENLRGRKTASGEVFDPSAYTAAHRTLRFGTWVEVRRTDISRSVRVRINDRGPFKAGRVIDLSIHAARDLDMIRSGVVPVEIRIVTGP